MQTKIKFPSSRLFLTLFVCNSLIILLQNNSNQNFIFNLICILVGAVITFLCFIPSAIIKNKTDFDFLSQLHIAYPNFSFFISIIYAIYFVYASGYFLNNYGNLLIKRVNSENNVYVMIAVLLAVCVYGAYRGVNAISRCCIFIFAFSIIAYLLFCCGNITNLNFEGYHFKMDGDFNEFLANTSFFTTTAVSSVIFAAVSGFTKKFKFRQIFFTTLFTTVLFSLFLFFIYFALGDFANAQDFPFFTLSKSAQINFVKGFDSFFISISTLAIFVLVSLLISCLNKASGNSSSLKMSIIYAVIIFVLYICTNNNSAKELLFNSYVLNIFTFITAVVVPSICLLDRRFRNA